MNAEPTGLDGVLVVEPQVFGDERGWFMENWRSERFDSIVPDVSFVQVNTSHSRFGVLRGLHYQWPQPQGKLVWVTAGCVFDVAVDIRRDSPSFGRWTGVELSADNHRQLWIPEGFAHGFQVVSDQATFSYLCTRPYRAEYDACIAWDDPRIGVDWPHAPSALSGKDAAAPNLDMVAKEKLPTCESC